MSKYRKRILLVSVLVVFVLGLALLLRPRNEPKYDGRYLSQWMDDLTSTDFAKCKAAEMAVQQIGTNAAPIFVNWLNTETPSWKKALRRRLPMRVMQSGGAIANWLGGADARRVALGMHGMCILGTNANAAVPELDRLLQNRTDPWVISMTIHALTGIGGTSVPVLKAAFANPVQPQRPAILWNLRVLSWKGYTNECMPIIIAALEDESVDVRSKATNLLQVTSYDDLILAQ